MTAFCRTRVDCWMPRANSARGKVRGALPRIPARGTPPETPAPFPSNHIFQNGPRRQGFAAPRMRAPLTAPGRSERFTEMRERGLMQSAFACSACRSCRPALQANNYKPDISRVNKTGHLDVLITRCDMSPAVSHRGRFCSLPLPIVGR